MGCPDRADQRDTSQRTGTGSTGSRTYHIPVSYTHLDVYKRQISANLAGIRKECMREALGDFKGVEHRLEKVCRVRGVDYINAVSYTHLGN